MQGNRFALIVASDQYEDTDLKKLIAPAQDARSLEQVLKDPAIGNFDVKVIINEPSYKVIEEIDSFFSDRHRDDILLLYFSCHGIKDEDGQLYFATVNTRRKRLSSTAIPSNFVNSMMFRSRSRQQILLLDCCYSGAFARGMTAKSDNEIHTKEIFEGRGRVILTASDAMQYSFEGEAIKGVAEYSVFTSAVVEGLKTGQADRDNDGDITHDELYEYVYDHIIDDALFQRPGKWAFDVQGNIVIAKSPNRMKGAIQTPQSLPSYSVAKRIPDSSEPKINSELSHYKTERTRSANTKIIILITVSAIVMVSIFAFSIFWSQQLQTMPNSNNTIEVKDSPVAQKSEQNPIITAVTKNISIVNGASQKNAIMYYDPQNVDLRIGDKVVWANNDNTIHTVTSGIPGEEGIGKVFDSGVLPQSYTFAHTFNQSGTFPYYCILHPYMRGQITVS